MSGGYDDARRSGGARIAGGHGEGGQEIGGGFEATHATGSANETPHQPERFEFDTESEAALDMIIKRYPPGKQASAVIPALYLVQRQMGRQTGSAWVPRVAMDVVAQRLGMPPIRVYEVATFYFMFNTLGVAGACALQQNLRWIAVWQQNFLWTAPGFFASASVAGQFASLFERCVRPACSRQPSGELRRSPEWA